ncbi:hypothetical protein [Rheinheimera sp. SA_1]|uniref:hypothetical protein n=1 Tax=Rheinheimera sp. SA_1 TaxID=1827365 RepID=UPI000A4632D4|nr:hypothetical protein [Rheinheimera sp. SA_1]
MDILVLLFALIAVVGFLTEGFAAVNFWQFFRGKKTWLERWFERQVAEKSHEK